MIALVTLMFVSIPAGRDLKFHELRSGVYELGDVGVICWVFLCVLVGKNHIIRHLRCRSRASV